VQSHWIKTHLPKYLEGLENIGLPRDPSGWRVAKCIFVADDEKVAKDYAKSDNGPYGFYFSNLMKKLGGGGRLGLFGTTPSQPLEEITLQQSLQTQVIAGTVNSVVDQILELREEVGPFGTLVYTGLDWADKELAQRSMILMAEEVLPRINKAIQK
jgi:alkanesulfonate monooxygenase SsuD/methylene tetrahydromethanopterin reductase-like flavin-dependent oxidoreductase (luciferase family)